MKITCLRETLDNGLGIVGRAVSARAMFPSLEHVLLTTDDGRLRLSATNLQIGITCWLGAQVEEDGAVSVPARTLTDLVKMLPEEPVGMVLDEQTLTLNLCAGRTEANLKGLDAADFPAMMVPTDGDRDTITVEAGVLREAIEQVALSASREESRMILTGVFARFESAQLTLAAADGFRLAVRTIPLPQPVSDAFEIIIPAQALIELGRILKSETGQVEIVVPSARNTVFFQFADVVLASQLIEGKFPDYRQIIPAECTTRTVLDRATFLRACKKALVFARDNGHIARLNVEHGLPGCINVLAKSAESGDDKSVVDASIEGNEIEVAFNVKYLIDVLSVIDTPQVALETTVATSPGVIRPVEDGTDYVHGVDYIHVIMPMHLGR
jgi:DNA polymerase-3 subunit beta